MRLNFLKFIKLVLSAVLFWNKVIAFTDGPTNLGDMERQISKLLSLPGFQEEDRGEVSSTFEQLNSSNFAEIVNCASQVVGVTNEGNRSKILSALLTALDKVDSKRRTFILRILKKE